jgi:hypothetical protein
MKPDTRNDIELVCFSSALETCMNVCVGEAVEREVYCSLQDYGICYCEIIRSFYVQVCYSSNKCPDINGLPCL